jgi:O-acetyl-ADP-ribose deacetylase (regulator of RNase III)
MTEHTERGEPSSEPREIISDDVWGTPPRHSERGVVEMIDKQTTTIDSSDEHTAIQNLIEKLSHPSTSHVGEGATSSHHHWSKEDSHHGSESPVNGENRDHPTQSVGNAVEQQALPQRTQKLKAAARRSRPTVRISAPEKELVEKALRKQRLSSPPPSNGYDSDRVVKMIRMGPNTPDLSHIAGDLLDLRCSIAHCISADVAMGQGMAHQINKRFHCKREVKRFQPKVGNVVVTPIREPYYQVIYHLVTKEKFYHKPEVEHLTKALTNLMSLAKMHKATTIAIPRIACGRDGQTWSNIEPIIQRVFSGSGIRIVVVTRAVDIPRFNPQSCPQGDMTHGEGRPDEEGEFGPRAFDDSRRGEAG